MYYRRSKLIREGFEAVLRVRIKRKSIYIACSGTTAVYFGHQRASMLQSTCSSTACGRLLGPPTRHQHTPIAC